jgi:head-tail adaptor
MSLRRKMKDRIVIETPSELVGNHVNEYGDHDETNTDYWVAAAEVRAAVYPAGSSEDEDDRETVSRKFDIYLGPEVSITANSRVRYIVSEDTELLCRVLAEPITYHRSIGGASHIVAKVEVVEG